MGVFSVLGSYLSDMVEQSIKEAVSPLAPYLRKLAFGVMLVVLATVAFMLVLAGVAGSIFLAFAQLPFGWAALDTAGIFLLLGLLFVLIGTSLLRRPR